MCKEYAHMCSRRYRRISTLRIHSDFEKDTIGFDDLLFWGGRGGGGVVNLLPNDHGFRKTIVNK